MTRAASKAKPAAPPAPLRNRIVGSGSEAPDQLVANPANWRIHPREQQRALLGSLEEVGWVQQVIVNQRTGNLVDGHARVEQALSRGEAEVPVLYVDLSAEEEALVLATLDPISAMAGIDPEKLGELVGGLRVEDDALRRLLGDLAGPAVRKPGLTDPDDAPPAPAATAYRRGELYALGAHRLLVGDSTSPDDVARLLGDAPVDLLWTDPPYGVAYEGGTAEKLTIKNDALSPAALRELVASALRLAQLRPGGVFYIATPPGPLHVEFVLAAREAGLQVRQTIVWVKDRFVMGRSDFHYRHEPILAGDVPVEPVTYDPIAYGWAAGAAHLWQGGRRLDTVWEVPRPARSREHPTMKPVELVTRALEYNSRPGDVVYDPFAGSGTTLIAAEQLGRRARVMELDPRYAQVIVERWQDFTGLAAERLDG